MEGSNNAISIREVGFASNPGEPIANRGGNNAIAGVNFGQTNLTTQITPLPAAYQAPLTTV